MSKWLLANELYDVSLFCQDWGGTIGLYLVGEYPERFDRVIASNTGIPRGDGGNTWLKVWLFVMRFAPLFPWPFAFRTALQASLSKEELYAYEKAPFPRARFQAGITKFPRLITIFPDNPELSINLRTWEKLEQFEKPFLTLCGDKEPVSRGGGTRFKKQVPCAQGQSQSHKIIAGGGHFIQGDLPAILVEEIIKFLQVN